MVSVHSTMNSLRFKFLQIKERFRKALFSGPISVDGRVYRRKKSCVFKFLRCGVDVISKSHWFVLIPN